MTVQNRFAACFFAITCFSSHSALATIVGPEVRPAKVGEECVKVPVGGFLGSICVPVVNLPNVSPFPSTKSLEVGSYCVTPAGRFGPGDPREVGTACFAATPLGFILGRIAV